MNAHPVSSSSPRSFRPDKPLQVAAPHRHRGARHVIPAVTAGLEVLDGHRVLALGDAENLSFGLCKDGLDCDFGAVRALLGKHAARLNCHVFATVPDGERLRLADRYFRANGWKPHLAEQESIATAAGIRRRTNADNYLLIWSGALISSLQPTLVLLASGDGDMGCDIARFLTTRCPGVGLATLSVPGTLSHRLRVEREPLIRANCWLGSDAIVSLARH